MSTSPAEIIAREAAARDMRMANDLSHAPSPGQLATTILAALEAEGFVVVPKARETMTYEAFEEWLHKQHREVGVTPALRKAYDDYLAATGRSNIKHSPVAEAQKHIDGKVVARMIINFHTEFRGIYPNSVHTDLCAVGPLHSLIGLAVGRGLLAVPAAPK